MVSKTLHVVVKRYNKVCLFRSQQMTYIEKEPIGHSGHTSQLTYDLLRIYIVFFRYYLFHYNEHQFLNANENNDYIELNLFAIKLTLA